LQNQTEVPAFAGMTAWGQGFSGADAFQITAAAHGRDPWAGRRALAASAPAASGPRIGSAGNFGGGRSPPQREKSPLLLGVGGYADALGEGGFHELVEIA